MVAIDFGHAPLGDPEQGKHDGFGRMVGGFVIANASHGQAKPAGQIGVGRVAD